MVRYISHRVAVMYRGESLESGHAVRVTTNPEHLYTKQLMLAAPVPDPQRQRDRRAQRRQLAAAAL